MLEIKNLKVAMDKKVILAEFNLTVGKGEIHALMGPNGAGKSTLAKVLAGDPHYVVLEGEILFEGKSILSLLPEERSHLGLFMGFQYPLEIPGVSNFQFLYAMHSSQRKARSEAPLSESDFTQLLHDKMRLVDVRAEFKARHLNTGFSGGEKKRNEILQMALLEPKLAILDETDSGLDIDAMKHITACLNQLMTCERSLILITHYNRLLDFIKPHFVHILVEGRLVQSGGPELALLLESQGYEGWKS